MIPKKFFVVIVISVFTILFESCTDPDSLGDKNKMSPKNYKLFQGTEVWPLARAIIQKKYDMIDSIVETNPDILDTRDSIYGNTILMLSIFHRDYELFSILLKHNPEINYHNDWKGSPIYEASRYGNSEVRFIADLLKKGANINDSIYNDDETLVMSTPLIEAAMHGNEKVLEFLIKNGANINFKSDFGMTALGGAMASKKYNNGLLLLQNGANFNDPISCTVDKKGNLTVPRYILESLRTGTPALYSKNFFQKKKIIKFLKEKGLDYESEPIPDYILSKIKNDYGLFWKIYVKYY